MSARVLRAGQRGIDCNTQLTALTAAAIHEHGYEFVIRYVPRVTQRAGDLTGAEVDIIRDANLSLMVVQHVESESAWVPTLGKGTLYGSTAARRCEALGIAHGTNVWCDLEGVASSVEPEHIIDYANQWCRAVQAAGFLPGLYVGWHCGLAPGALYHRLAFAHYWSAYNLNVDQYPAVRGVQMRQRAAKPDDIPAGVAFPIDVNIVTGDHLGGFPMADAPDLSDTP